MTRLISAGILERFQQDLDSSNDLFKAEAAWALSNIACDCQEYADLIMQKNDLFSRIITAMTYPNLQVRKEAIFIVSNLIIHGSSTLVN